MHVATIGALALWGFGLQFAQIPLPSSVDLIQLSSRAVLSDWERAPTFDFCESDRTGEGRDYQVTMIAGSPYKRLVAIGGAAISHEAQQSEAKKQVSVSEERQNETPLAHQSRLAQYEKERRRNQLLLEELTSAMEFTLIGSQRMGEYDTYVLEARPKPGYIPKSTTTKVLTGMKGTLWIDKSSFRWVKVTAEVVHPVTIEGFLARVEPGTRFELEERPLQDPLGTWLVTHFLMKSRATILWLFPKSSMDNQFYSHYKPNGQLSPGECLQ